MAYGFKAEKQTRARNGFYCWYWKSNGGSLLAEGAEVIVNGRTEEKVQSVVDELSRHGNVHGIAADLSDPEESRALVEKPLKSGSLMSSSIIWASLK